jgi:hypothetical protein
MDVHLLDQSHVFNFQAKDGDQFYYVTIHTDKNHNFTHWEVLDKHGQKIQGPIESNIVNKIRIDWDKLTQ